MKWYKRLKFNIEYFFKKLSWLFIINSPFKFPEIYYYLGERKIGLPYKCPHKFIDITLQPLWWKIKYERLVHEYSPCWSFSFWKWQLVIFFGNNEMMDMCRWEAWLYYKRKTDKKQSKEFRLKQVLRQYKVVYTRIQGDKRIVTNYYYQFLKSKYLKFLEDGAHET